MSEPASHVDDTSEFFVLRSTTSSIAPVLVELAQRCDELSPDAFAEVAAYRVRIEQAKGLLMYAYGIDADNAFEVLTRWSQATNIKLRLLAVKLVDDFSALTPTEWPDSRSACDQILFELLPSPVRRGSSDRFGGRQMTTSTSNEAAGDIDPGTAVESFLVQEQWIGRTVVLALTGDLDTLSAPSLRHAIDAAVNQRPSTLIIDMTDLDFLASAGMTALVIAQHQVGDLMRLALVADGPATSRPLKMMGLDSVLQLYPTLDDALNAR